jgi:hypothetical protein
VARAVEVDGAVDCFNLVWIGKFIDFQHGDVPELEIPFEQAILARVLRLGFGNGRAEQCAEESEGNDRKCDLHW